MPATAEREKTERPLETATADPAPPGMGEDGYPVRMWTVDGETVAFSLKPYTDAERPRYWYTGVGARLRVKAQGQNEWGVQPVVLNDRFVDGSFSPRNAWEEQVTREFLRRNHIDPDRSRDERHPDGPTAMYRCAQGFCNFACPSWHVFKAHQKALGHNGIRDE